MANIDNKSIPWGVFSWLAGVMSLEENDDLFSSLGHFHIICCCLEEQEFILLQHSCLNVSCLQSLGTSYNCT